MRWSKAGPESNKGQPTKSCASNTYAVRDVQQQPLIINLVFKYRTLVFCIFFCSLNFRWHLWSTFITAKTSVRNKKIADWI